MITLLATLSTTIVINIIMPSRKFTLNLISSSSKDLCGQTTCVYGTCTQTGQYTFQCNCDDGYTGALCDSNINECASTPCNNHGRCTDGIDGYTCSCDRGFSGAQCEINIDDCMPNPCQNFARCTDQANGFTCSCNNGWTGVLCETNIGMSQVSAHFEYQIAAAVVGTSPSESVRGAPEPSRDIFVYRILDVILRII
ncbi:hypothetical protein LSH36_95g07036 [Paralvinella palmiformis]|uniref:EGF-like domain-containing protein n=1 Tax=Paralvinella palmiformis TaxID=53620 RepID=A0AAD9NA80_9ANNE|nr:hypothetical protein LSH36_95g07036 [Paralvinella palmiformis]